jgi:hypothetical protein
MMDRKKSWAWVEEHMPLTVAMLREYRQLGEGAHIDECWLRGVVAQEPNWFFAREGGISIGVPFEPRPGTVLGAMEQCEQARSGTLLLLAPLPLPVDLNARRKGIAAGAI